MSAQSKVPLWDPKTSLSISKRRAYCNWKEHVNGYTTANHAHIGTEIVYFESSTGFYRVANRNYPIKPGTILVFPASFPHQPIVFQNYIRWNLCILPEYLDDISKLNKLVTYGRMNPVAQGKLHTIFQNLSSELSEQYSRGKGNHGHIRLLLQEFTHWLSRGLTSDPLDRYEKRTVERNQVMHQLIHHIDNHFYDDLTVESLAEAVNYSPVQIWRIMRLQTGQSPMEYINNRRLDRARKLILHSDQSISSIAHMVGFQSAAYFSRVFKEKMGFTPTEFRKRTTRQ